MIIFNHIHITSFKSIYEASLDFDDLKGKLYSLEGVNHTVDFAHSNGAGKSTLLQALMFALYGSVDDSVTIKKAEYQNKNTNVKLRVQLLLTIQGQRYTIVRTDKDFKLFKGDEDISELTKTDTEKKFQAILNLTKSEFINFTYLSQSSTSSFLTKTPMEKLNCIKDFIFNDELLAIQTRLDSMIKSCKSQDIELGRQLAQLEGRISTMQSVIAKHNEEKVQLPCTLEAYQGQLSALQTQQNEADNERRHLASDKAELESLREKFKKGKAKLMKIKDENVCPTCGQTLPDTSTLLEESRKRLQAIRGRAAELKIAIQEREVIVGNYPDYREKLIAISSNIATLKQQARTEKQYKEMQGDVGQLEAEVNELQAKIDANNLKLTQLTQLNKYFKTDFIKYIQKSFINEIENYLNLYCRDIFNADFGLEFVNNSLELTIGGMPYSYFSGGERQRIDFLFVFAIKVALTNFTNKCTNLLIADESLSGQDSEAFENCLDLISGLTAAEELTTILVSHRDLDYKISKITIERFADKTSVTVQEE